jgi:hypothetical protein
MAKDLYHNAVREALEKDGWTITHDPFRLIDKKANMSYEIDLGAEKLLAAERGTEQIAVEIKSFLKTSFTHEFHGILGQYITYTDALDFLEFKRELILAIPLFALERLQEYPFLTHLIEKHNLKLLVYDELQKNVVEWRR